MDKRKPVLILLFSMQRIFLIGCFIALLPHAMASSSMADNNGGPIIYVILGFLVCIMCCICATNGCEDIYYPPNLRHRESEPLIQPQNDPNGLDITVVAG